MSESYPKWIYRSAITIWMVVTLTPLVGLLIPFLVQAAKEPSLLGTVILDGRQWILLGRSLGVACGTTIVAFALGLPTAMMLSARDLPLRRLCYGLILIPLLIPSYVMAGAWIHLLSPMGSLHAWLASILGSWFQGINLFGPAGCAWCLGVSFFPLVALVVGAGLSDLDTSVCDAARLSTGRWGVWRFAVFPQIRSHLIASLCLVLIFVLAQYGVPSLLGVNTYPVEIFSQFSAFYNHNKAVAMALPLIGLVLVLILIQQRVMRQAAYVRLTPSSDTSVAFKLKRYRYGGFSLVLTVFLLTTTAPFISVLAHLRHASDSLMTLRASWDCMFTTLILGGITALLSTVLAWPVAQYLVQCKTRKGRGLDTLCWLPIAIPGTLIGLGWIKVSHAVPMLREYEAYCPFLICAYLGMFSAFSIRIMKATFEQADPHIAETAMLQCRHWIQRLFCLDLPLHVGGIGVSLIIVFVLVLGELNATILLIPPGRETLAVTIDNFLHYGASVQASVLCLTTAAFVIVAVGSVILFNTAIGARRQ